MLLKISFLITKKSGRDIGKRDSTFTKFQSHSWGYHFPDQSTGIEYSSYKNTKLPNNINDLAFYSIGELAELIRTKQISSVKLTEFFLQRLKKYDPVLHCVITFTEERAMKQANQMDKELAEGKYRGIAARNTFWS